jgi:hypothetical protein
VTANTAIRYRARVPEIRPSCPTSKAAAPFLLAPCSRVFLEELPSSQPVKKFPAFYETRKFITAFTSTCHLSLSRVSWSQSIPPTTHCMMNHLIIFPSTPGSPKWSLSLWSPHQSPVHASPLPHTRYTLHGMQLPPTHQFYFQALNTAQFLPATCFGHTL